MADNEARAAGERCDAAEGEVHHLKVLAEQLLLRVAERDVEIEAQNERHLVELEEHKWLAATPSERAWLAMPVWLRDLVGCTLSAAIVFIWGAPHLYKRGHSCLDSRMESQSADSGGEAEQRPQCGLST